MRIFLILCAIPLCFTACCGSGKTMPDYPKGGNKVKPYDPKKAGAVIVNSFDITDKIPFLETEVYEEYHIYFTKKTDYDLAEHNGRIYIRVKKTLYVFDKNSMKKLGEIFIKLPEKYDYLPNNRFPASGHGLAVIGNQAFVCFLDFLSPPWPSYFFIVDLDTGNAEYISEENLGMNYSDGRQRIMGYDKQKDALWFRKVSNDSNWDVLIYYFQYDDNTKAFTKIGEEVWDYKANGAVDATDPRRDPPRARLITSSIYGNESWNVYEYPVPRLYEPAFFVVDKRNMDSLTEPIGSIDVSYLGTLSLPQRIIYDKPYIWIMVERKGRIQMLKLLPNG